MKLPNINTKSPVFLPSIALTLIVLFALIVPGSTWKKIFSNNFGFATVFQTGTSGDWKNPLTWGLTNNVASNIQFTFPLDVEVASSGEIYVSDTGADRIVVLNPDGSASTTYPTLGAGDSGFGITFAPDGEIYLAERDHALVEVLNHNGTASTTYTSGVGLPNDLVFAPTGEIYIASFWDSSIYILNPDGTASTSYSGISGLVNPRGIALSPTGEIYTANEGNSLISVLNPDGTASTTYSAGMVQPYNIKFSPTGSGEMYITDRGNNRVVVLNPGGSASTTYTGIGLSTPDGLTFGPGGKIYIANTYGGYGNTGHITVLNPNGTLFASYTHPPVLIPNYVAVEGVDYPGFNDNVVINSGTVTLSHDQNVNNLTLAPGGTLNLAGHTLNVRGDWTNTGGTLVSNGGTVNLTSTSTQSIFGANTFENLRKYSTVNSSLLFDPYNTTTITGNLLLSGIPGKFLTIGPATGSLIPGYVSSIGGIPSGFDFPYIVGVSPVTNKAYVYDSSNGNGAYVINTDGSTATSTFGSPVAAYAYAVKVSPSGIVYIIDGNSGNVVGINENGAVATTTFGQGLINYPQDLDISPTGEIYIADSNNYQIAVLNPDGTASTTFSGPLSYPAHVAVSPVTGETYVIDYGLNSVVAIDPDGTVATTNFTSALSTPIYYPQSIKVSPSGIVYIVDNSNNGRIVGLHENGTVATTTLGEGLTNDPQYIDISPAGYIYIADASNNRILVLNPDGTASTTYTNQVEGGFNSPQGIAHDSSDNIYVVDQSLNNIQKFNSSGSFISFLNTTGLGVLNGPLDLAIDLLNNVYVADIGNLRIVQFDSSGNYSTSSPAINLDGGLEVDNFGYIYVTIYSPGYELLKLDQDFNLVTSTSTYGGSSFSFCQGSITLDPTGNFLYVADRCNNQIVKLNTSDLSYISSTAGPIQAPFSSAYDIAIDADGNIYVSDYNNYRIVKLAPDFSYMTQWGTYGNGNNQFASPNRLTIDSNNNLYVTDTYNKRIQKFNLTTAFTPFNLLYTVSGTTTFSFLSVSGSNSTGPGTFYCVSGCIDAGSNTNWVFGPYVPYYPHGHHYSNSTSTSPALQSYFQMLASSTTPTSTTTIPIVTTQPISTTTKPIVKPTSTSTKPIIKPVIKPKPTTPSLPTVPTVTTPTPSTPQNPSTPGVKSNESAITPSLLANIEDNIAQTYLQAMGILGQAGHTIANIINSPTGSIITKIIATVGIILGSLAALAGIAFATPITFSEVWLLPSRIFGLMLGALGIRKKQRPWGTVYDAITKRPLDPAYVTLINTVTGKEVGTAITDLDGRYSFSVVPGTYKIIAAKTNYAFPSVKMMNAAFDEVYNDIYHGNEITVTTDGEVITKNIPMDPQTFDWNEFTKNKMNINTFTKGKDITWARVSKYFFIIGFIISVIALLAAPQPYNMIIMAIYIVAYILNYFVFKGKKAGTLRDKATGLPLSFAIIKVFREGMTDTPILKKIADKEGKYYALLPKGNYLIHIDKKNDDATYTTIYKSDLLTFDTGVINQDVEV